MHNVEQTYLLLVHDYTCWTFLWRNIFFLSQLFPIFSVIEIEIEQISSFPMSVKQADLDVQIGWQLFDFLFKRSFFTLTVNVGVTCLNLVRFLVSWKSTRNHMWVFLRMALLYNIYYLVLIMLVFCVRPRKNNVKKIHQKNENEKKLL